MEQERNPAATLAAQMIAESGLSWHDARRELLAEGAVRSSKFLPKDEEIEAALREHYAIFDPMDHEERLKVLRLTALYWMERLENYQPRLIKGVLNGCADKYSNIYLQIFADDPKSLEIELLDSGLEIECDMDSDNRRSPRDPDERIFFTAPFQGRFSEDPQEEAGIVLDVFIPPNQPPRIKTSFPDAFQIPEECVGSASIKQVQALISAKYPHLR